MFKGWFSEEGVPIVNGPLVKTARNHIIHTNLAEIVSERVKITFVPNVTAREDEEDFVRGYANAKFGSIKLEAHS